MAMFSLLVALVLCGSARSALAQANPGEPSDAAERAFAAQHPTEWR